LSEVAPRRDLTYRRDLDGLRGIAVAAVVAYHLGVPFASGGFVGVDVFFVLSGFLITSIIASGLEAGTFSIAGFYDRRIRRIVPALVFVCACTTVLALAFLLPDELKQFASSLVGTALSVSNFWCLRHSGYFDSAAETQPLFHTWSLGVEEQFYIIFPLLLIAVFRWWRGRLRTIIWLLFAASLILSMLLLQRYPKSTFFLLHTRAWELLAGSIIALGLVPKPASRLQRDAAGALGLLAIAIAVFGYTSKTPFPGLAAVLPCLGAALVIWAGQGENTPARLLAAGPLVFLGLISYSLYLWHWPVIVFANLLNVEALTELQKLAVAGTSIALAALTWRFIEQPFRRRGARGFTRPAILRSGSLGLGSLVAVSLILIAWQGVPGRYSHQVVDLAAAGLDSSPFRDKCHFQGALKRTYDDTCVLGDKVDPKIIVYSDSHGAEFSAALGSLAKSRNESVRQITASACPPAANYSLSHGTRCGDYNAAMLARLIAIPPSTILIAANSMSWSTSRSDQYWKGLQTTLAALHRAGHRLIVLGAVPSLPNHRPAPEALARWVQLGNDPANFTFTPDAKRLRDVNAKLKDLAAEMDATYVPIAPAFCNDDRCRAYLEGAVLYFDDNHLSVSGANVLAKKLLVPLLWPETKTPIIAGAQSQR
jgi:peptidoglycan/LPS O-acetylase OafA/YrhL